MSDWLGLKDKVCVVTGAVGGMGVQICQALAAQQATVVALDMDQAKVADLVTQLINEEHIAGLAVSCDVTKETSVQHAVDQVKDTFGHVD
ncbi:SDR family NAD(P)-dependent oxidoreductase, partial [Lacticaseibacillus paracasei]